jgi:hypothetical protein
MNFQRAFFDELSKIAKKEYAPGIPSKTRFSPIRKIKKPEQWEFVVQRHKAKRAGEHFDFRLGDPKTGRGPSWAMKYLPNKGEQNLGVQKPTHTIPYLDFKGEIKDGYGAGNVETHIRDKVDVIESNNDKIRFVRHLGKGHQEYVMMRTGEKDWRVVNKKPIEPLKSLLPTKLDIKAKDANDIDFNDESKILSAKIDGGSSTIVIEPNRQIRAFSPRRRSGSNELIEYTPKIDSMYGEFGSPKLGRTKVLGEAFVDSDQGVVPARTVGGILNAGTLKSRELQKQHGPLRVSLYDVHMYKGKDVKDLHYSDKLKIIQNIIKEHPIFTTPEIARTAAEKKRLVQQIFSGKHPQTEEGVVEWGKDPVKIKSHRIDDAWVVGIQPGRNKYEGVGGGALIYSLERNGKPVGKVGSGFTDDERKNMIAHPKNWIGKKITIKHVGQMPSGAFRSPTYNGEHL